MPTYAGLLLIGRQLKIKELMPTAEAAFQMLRGTDVSVNESFFLPLLAAAERIMSFIDARNPEQEMARTAIKLRSIVFFMVRSN